MILKTGGAEHWAQTIIAIRKQLPTSTIEVLTPDFQERIESLKTVCEARPDVFNHNIETVRRLTPKVRSRSDYDRTLRVLQWVKLHYPNILTKSGLMVGHGETENEVLQTLQDLREYGVNILTIGQYLRSDLKLLPVAEFIHPEKFDFYAEKARELGFSEVASGPFVRSSYNARESFLTASQK